MKMTMEEYKAQFGGSLKSKFGNSITIYNGEKFHSKKEAGYAQYLDMMIKAKRVTKYEKQIPFDIVINNVKICKYVLDYAVHYPSGVVEYVDVKPFDKRKKKFILNPVYQLKKKMMKAVHGINLKEI